MADRPITRRWRLFAEELLRDPNAARAARAVGVNDKNARHWAARVKADPDFQAYYAARLAEAEAETRIQTHRVLEELAVVAFSSVDDYLVDDLGRVTVKDGAPDGAMRAVSSIKHRIRSTDDGTEREVELRLWDKNPALANALKRLGLVVDRHEHTGKDGAPIVHAVTVRFVKPGGEHAGG